MKLTESQLFTIEALNRIEGFEWPDGGLLASANKETKHVVFWAAGHIPLALVENGTEFDTELCKRYKHQYWNNTIITRAEFESVGGWVRHSNGDMPVDGDSMVQVQVKMHLNAVSPRFPASDFNWIDGDIEYWRYAKPRNQPEKATDITPAHSIETLIGQHKAARAATLEARRQLDSAETAERELMRDIEAWAESHGFDIRLLEGGEEKPELVITDWRDLEIGDVVQWTLRSGDEFTVYELFRDSEDGNPCATITAGDKLYSAYDGEIKFIRRPAK